MREHLGEYEEHLKGRGLTAAHIQSIRFQVEEFFDFLTRTGDKEITRAKVSAYQTYLREAAVNQKGKPLRARLLSKRLYALKRFLRFLTQRRLFLLDPARDLLPLKTPRPLPSYIPGHGEIKEMIESIPKTGYGLRDRAMLELLYSTGIRAGELLSLTLYDIDLEGKRVLVRKGKGAKDRVVPLGEKAQEALQEYLTFERPKRKTKSPLTSLFLTRTGKPLTYPVLIKTLQRYRPDPRIRPHTIRHASALGMLRNGADIRYIQELLGHTRLETTSLYTRILPLELQSIHHQFHPRERIREKERNISPEPKTARAHLTTARTQTLKPKENQSFNDKDENGRGRWSGGESRFTGRERAVEASANESLGTNQRKKDSLEPCDFKSHTCHTLRHRVGKIFPNR